MTSMICPYCLGKTREQPLACVYCGDVGTINVGGEYVPVEEFNRLIQHLMEKIDRLEEKTKEQT